MYKVLNLYAGIGGNRRFWKDISVTAVEINEPIAKIYKDFFPNDKIVFQEAHDFLIKHYKEFDFIWSSPPCQTHSKTMYWNHIKKRYPDMRLYEEIIFLKHFCYVPWVIENVKSYYTPLIKPSFVSKRHFFWSNFPIKINYDDSLKIRNDGGCGLKIKQRERKLEIKNYHGFKGDKRPLFNNMIEPEIGLDILNCAIARISKNT